MHEAGKRLHIYALSCRSLYTMTFCSVSNSLRLFAIRRAQDRWERIPSSSLLRSPTAHHTRTLALIMSRPLLSLLVLLVVTLACSRVSAQAPSWSICPDAPTDIVPTTIELTLAGRNLSYVMDATVDEDLTTGSSVTVAVNLQGAQMSVTHHTEQLRPPSPGVLGLAP
jgi:hypothetical protein